MSHAGWLSHALEEGVVVALPGVGTLRAKRQPATIHPITHQFHPPYLSVEISADVSDAEGLYAWLSRSFLIDLEQASNLCKHLAEAIKSQLSAQGYADLDGWGQLKRNPENELQLVMHRTLVPRDAYGFPKFIMPPVLPVQHSSASASTVRSAARRLFWIRL
ncbi:MAG: hypothetical protein NZL95_02540 [Chitinophagales bacterium]|nr:hypothetical protein [Chitinophagales bacterium]MDW8427411.1 hypothetical protein [Chitinophagales bacterium]